jgi:hypothetical protein
MGKPLPDNEFSVDAIKAPTSPPSTLPCPGAVEEESTYDRAERLSKLSPTAKHLHANEQLLTELRRSNDALASSHDKLAIDRDVLLTELANLRPRYAALQIAKRRTTLTVTLCTIAFTIGGCLISSPSYAAKFVTTADQIETVSNAIFGAGWGCVGVATLILVVTTVYGMFFD